MEQRTTVIQKSSDLISQYDHFLAAVKERAASFLGNAAGVNRSIEADFEALHVMLEQRKKVLLAQVQEEMTASRENDIIELEAKQRKMHSSLKQLQQLAVSQGLLSEDNECYQHLLAELTEAKQKLKETSDMFQIKFEGFLKPLAGKIANYGQVVSGRGKRGDEQKSMLDTSVDFARVFAVLSSQFEAQCQLQATRKEVKSFSESNANPFSGWFEYSKKLQWRRSTTALSSQPAVPDFASIIKKLKDDFTKNLPSSVAHPVNVPDESYKKWLAPRGDKHQDVTIEWLSTSTTPSANTFAMASSSADTITRGFNAIASSDTSSWLLHSSLDDGMSEDNSCFNADTSPWLLRCSSEDDKLSMLIPLEQDYNEWLNPVKDYQTWLTTGGYEKQPSKEDDVSDWLHQGYNWTDDSNVQWLLPRGGSVPPGEDSDKHSDIFGSTQTLTSFGSSDFEVVDDTDL